MEQINKIFFLKMKLFLNFKINLFNLLFKKIKSRKTNIKFVTCSSANNIEIKNILTQ